MEQKVGDYYIFADEIENLNLESAKNRTGATIGYLEVIRKGEKYKYMITNGCHRKFCKKIKIIEDDEDFKEGEEVLVYDEKKCDNKRIFLAKIGTRYLCVSIDQEKSYRNGNNDYCASFRTHCEKIKDTIKIKCEDGQELEITKEKAKELGFNIL